MLHCLAGILLPDRGEVTYDGRRVDTVKTHVNRLMAKLGLSSRAQAVVAAYESGLVVAGRSPSD